MSRKRFVPASSKARSAVWEKCTKRGDVNPVALYVEG